MLHHKIIEDYYHINFSYLYYNHYYHKSRMPGESNLLKSTKETDWLTCNKEGDKLINKVL